MNLQPVINVNFKDFINFNNLIDFFLVLLFIYIIYTTLRKLNLLPLLFLIVAITTIIFIAQVTRLTTISWIFSAVQPYIYFIIIVMLHVEFRSALFNFLNNTFLKNLFRKKFGIPIKEVLGAIHGFLKKGYGAIIIFTDQLEFHSRKIEGITINSDVSKELLISIFNPKSPLHDGAVIIRGNKIISASNYFSLSDSQDLDKTFGARHRAALGISEETDSLVVFISEESKSINIAYLAKLYQDISLGKLKSLLEIFSEKKSLEKYLNNLMKKNSQNKALQEMLKNK